MLVMTSKSSKSGTGCSFYRMSEQKQGWIFHWLWLLPSSYYKLVSGVKPLNYHSINRICSKTLRFEAWTFPELRTISQKSPHSWVSYPHDWNATSAVINWVAFVHVWSKAPELFTCYQVWFWDQHWRFMWCNGIQFVVSNESNFWRDDTELPL